MDRRIVIVLVLAVIGVGSVVVYFNIPKREPIYPDIHMEPPPSDLDLQYSRNFTLEGASENPDRLEVSTESFRFFTSGDDICVFVNFSVTGEGDEKIDFMVLTNQGYSDFMDDGDIDDSTHVKDTENDTGGDYYCEVLPYEFNGHQVYSWYIVYSAYRKPGPGWFGLLPAQKRDVSAVTCKDRTPPQYARGAISNSTDGTLEFDLWVWDHRCKTTAVRLEANDTLVKQWNGRYSRFNEMVSWDTADWDKGNYTLTLYVQDAVGNSRTYSLATVQVVAAPTIPERILPIINIYSIVAGIFSIFIAILVLAIKKYEILSIIISITSISGNVLLGPLDILKTISAFCGIISLAITLGGMYRRYRERKRYQPKGEPTGFI